VKHILKFKYVKTTCDDCSGHTHGVANCSCGWKKDLYGVNYPGISFESVVAEFEHMKHRLEELEKQ
jgi:hypothetical protein